MIDFERLRVSKWVEENVRSLGVTNQKLLTKKPWGMAVAFCESKLGQMSLAIIDAGGFCSRHYHAHKANVFTVYAGTLAVHIWDGFDEKQATRPPDRVLTVERGSSIVVPPNVVHLMTATANCLCVESYFNPLGGKVCTKDIHRLTTGGKN